MWQQHFSQQYNVTLKLELRKTQVTNWIILDASSLSHWKTHHPNLIILSWSRAFIASSSLFICIRIMATTSRHSHICCLLYVFAQRTGQGKVRRVNKHQSHCFVDFGRSWEVQPSPQRAVVPSVVLYHGNLREHLRQICYQNNFGKAIAHRKHLAAVFWPLWIIPPYLAVESQTILTLVKSLSSLTKGKWGRYQLGHSSISQYQVPAVNLGFITSITWQYFSATFGLR